MVVSTVGVSGYHDCADAIRGIQSAGRKPEIYRHELDELLSD
jgi:hypothetical protein